MMVRSIPGMALAGVLALCAPAGADPLTDDLQALLAEAREDTGSTGVVLMIAQDSDSLTVTEGDATAQTRFYLASVGKTLVAAAILNAVEAGALALDAPLGARVADLPMGEIASSRSLRAVLAHTSGLGDYLDDYFVSEQFARPNHRWTVAEALDFADPDDTVPEGARFDYSNTNYLLLGHLLEGLDGSLDAALAKRVFTPAGMTASSVGAAPGPDVARGYDLDGTDVSAVLWNSTLGDGPVVASAPDVVRFATALFQTDRIIGSALRTQMLREALPGADYGLGIGIDRDEWGVWYGHSGGYEGAATEFRYYPQSQTVLVVLANGEIDTDMVLNDAAAFWFDQ